VILTGGGCSVELAFFGPFVSWNFWKFARQTRLETTRGRTWGKHCPVRAKLLSVFSRQRSSKPDGFIVRGSDMAFSGPRKSKRADTHFELAFKRGSKIKVWFMFQSSQFLKTLVGNRATAKTFFVPLLCRGAFWPCRSLSRCAHQVAGRLYREEAFV